MAESSKSMQSWTDAWTDVQRKSWESWSSMMQQALSPSPSAITADPWRLWLDGMQQWRNALTPKADGTVQDVYGKLFEQGMNYMRLTQEVFKAFQGMQSATKLGQDWMKVLSDILDRARTACANASPGGNDMVQGCLALWGLPMDNWRRVMSSMSAFPGDMLQGIKEQDVQHVGDALRANLEKFLSIPPLGYTREWQEQGQEAAQIWLRYQQAMSRYLTLIGKVGTRTMDLLQARVTAMAADEQQVESLREVYNMLVDCAEDAYAEVASDAEYAEVSAHLLNASMALKRHGQLMVEEMVSAMNMPSRHELDTAHSRTHHLKRELKALQQQLKDAGPKTRQDGLQALQDEVRSLRTELDALKTQGAAPEAAAPVRAKTSGAGKKTQAARNALVSGEVKTETKAGVKAQTKGE
jgi:class III poly(R)-hydroxyalkanoic acid synthase PhaE subunit